MIDNESKRERAAKSIVELCGKLNTAVETYVQSSTELGHETQQNAVGAPLNRVRVIDDVQAAVLMLLPAAKLPGSKARTTQAKFSRGLRLGSIELQGRI